MKKQEFKHGVIFHADIIELLESGAIQTGDFDHVLTDPPYGYLNHEIETDFDREKCWQLISKNHPKGHFLLFGRGDVFYQDNLILKNLNYAHKEDCFYIKNQTSSPFLKLQRLGESFAIRRKGDANFNEVRFPLSDKENISDNQVIDQIRRALFKKGKKEIYDYVFHNIKKFDTNISAREQAVFKPETLKKVSREMSAFLILEKGFKLKNVIYADRNLLDEGSHPTIKDIKALGYLIEFIANEGETVFDPFIGSGSTAIACLQTGRRFIGCEINEKYFDLTCRRIENEYQKNIFLSYGKIS